MNLIVNAIVGACILALSTVAATPVEKGWTCRGDVHQCTSPKHRGESYGCLDVIGYGGDEHHARRNGAERCEAALEADKGGGFFCADTSGMSCQASEDPN